MGSWTRAQRKRHRDEAQAGIEKPFIRAALLTPKQKEKRAHQAAQVAKRLLGKKR